MKQDNGFILSANRLGDGRVVFMTAAGAWSPNIQDATIAREDTARAMLEERAKAGVDNNHVIDPLFSSVEETENATGHIFPHALRERIRAGGPTIDYAPKKQRKRTT